MTKKRLDFTKENFRLLAFIISNATSGTYFTKMLKDAGWTPESTATQEWQLSKKSKEAYLFDELTKIAEQERIDVFDYVVEKTLKKDPVYFKKEKGYKFPQQPFSQLKKKLKVIEAKPIKRNILLFNDRKLHSSIIYTSKRLFSDGYYSQAIFEACKLLNKHVQEVSRVSADGKNLMLTAFSPNNPKIRLNKLSDQSDRDEQEGFMHIFAGTMQGVRNPKGHDLIVLKDAYRALEYLGLVSLLFKRLDERT